MAQEVDLNRIELFREVVLAGSFSRAAARLRMPKSRVSRHIAQLEHDLGIALIYRTTRQFRLTQAGGDLFQRTAPLLKALQSTLEEVSSGAEEIAGLIKVTVPEDIGSELFGRICHDFLTLYPRVEIGVLASNQIVDLVKDSIDVAVRIGPARDSSMIRRKIGSVGLILCASPDFLARHGTPLRLEQLEKLPFLSFGAIGQGRQALKMTNGRENRSIRVNARFSCNNFFVLRSMACEGSGITAMPAFLARELFASGKLVPVLKEWSVETSPVQILIPSQKDVPHKIRAFVDFLAERLAPSL
jgi:DNA-binding transcriptional LysR family regulator